MKLTPIDSRRTSASPLFGFGVSISTYSSASAPPCFLTWIACIWMANSKRDSRHHDYGVRHTSCSFMVHGNLLEGAENRTRDAATTRAGQGRWRARVCRRCFHARGSAVAHRIVTAGQTMRSDIRVGRPADRACRSGPVDASATHAIESECLSVRPRDHEYQVRL